MKKGFILIENMTAFFLLALFLSAFFITVTVINHNLNSAHKKLRQVQQVKNQIETLKSLSIDQIKSDPAQGLEVKWLQPDLLEAALTTLNEQWIFRLAR